MIQVKTQAYAARRPTSATTYYISIYRWLFDAMFYFCGKIRNRQIQAALYTFLMTLGVDSDVPLAELCRHGDIIKTCKSIFTVEWLVSQKKTIG